MPVTFSADNDARYFIAKYTGEITEEEVLRVNNLLFESKGLDLRLHALVDLSEAKFPENSNEAIRRVSQFFERVLIKNGTHGLKGAIYAPNDFSYGIARVYEAMTMMLSQTVRVFRDIDEAKKWLEESIDIRQ